MFEIHRAAAWALILLIPWKAVISIRSLKRGLDRRPDHNILIVVSVVLSITSFVVIFFGLVWKWNLSEYYFWIGNYAYTPVGWHWGIAIGLVPFFLLHVWRRWPRPKRIDFTERRQALKLLGIGFSAVVGLGISERRFTGSRESGSFTGLDYPVTSGPDQGKIKLDPETWKLHLTGAVAKSLSFTYDDLLALSSSEVIATLDCTGGWYSKQAWQGVRLADLLEQTEILPMSFGIKLNGVLEYCAPFILAEAREILLATYVGGLALDHRHGYPLRAVVPSRRGWHWVKWMTEIEVIAF